MASVLSQKSVNIRPPSHPGSRRCARSVYPTDTHRSRALRAVRHDARIISETGHEERVTVAVAAAMANWNGGA